MQTPDTDDLAPWLSRAQPLLDALSAHSQSLGIGSLSITRSLPARVIPSNKASFARALVAISARHRALIPHALKLRQERLHSPPTPERLDALRHEHQRALDQVTSAAAIIRDARATSTVLVESLHSAQPELFTVIETASARWESPFHPLTSPRKHVQDIARQASDCARAEIERWMRVEGARIVAFAVDRKLRLATERIEALERYLSIALGFTPDEVRDELSAVQSDALTRAFGVELLGTDAARTVATALAGAVLSAMLGYALADVLLYYVLHAIIGFLNPWLLATSLAGATALYLARGDAFVRNWIKSQVVTRMRQAFDKPEHQKSLDEALDKGLRDMLDALAVSFEASAREAIDAAHQQHTALDDTTSFAGAEAHGRQALDVLEQLDALAREMRIE